MQCSTLIKTNAVCFLLAVGGLGSSAMAAEDFRVRYNLAGTLGGEIFAPAPTPGWVGAFSLTHVDGQKITGNDGQDLVKTMPGGNVPLAPGGTPLDPSYAANPLTLKTTVRANAGALALAYVPQGLVAGGQVVWSGVVPLVDIRTQTTPVSSVPSLQWPSAMAPDAATRAAVAARFGQEYTAGIQAEASQGNARSSGVGDVELASHWLRVDGPWKLMAGAALVLPTGKYSASPGLDPGFGNFYTFRPEARLTYQPSARWAFAGKLAWGLNTRNRDNQWRSGDWYGVEAAAGYMTALGPVGVQVVHIQQYRDDRNNLQFGASRFEMDGAGLFWTTRIPALDLAVSLQHMATTRSRNALHSNFTQLRLVKTF